MGRLKPWMHDNEYKLVHVLPSCKGRPDAYSPAAVYYSPRAYP